MLTDRQERFVEEYLVDRNATQAAIRAGYSAATAGQGGDQLLKNIEVRKLIDAASEKQSHRLQIDADRVLTEIAAMAFYDPAALAEVSVEVAPGEYQMQAITAPDLIKNLPEDVRRAIVGWSWDRNGNFTLKLADKSKALDMLARHKSLYNDKIQVNSMDGIAERLMRARMRKRIDDLPTDDLVEVFDDEPDQTAQQYVEGPTAPNEIEAEPPPGPPPPNPIDLADRLKRARERKPSVN